MKIKEQFVLMKIVFTELNGVISGLLNLFRTIYALRPPGPRRSVWRTGSCSPGLRRRKLLTASELLARELGEGGWFSALFLYFS